MKRWTRSVCSGLAVVSVVAGLRTPADMAVASAEVVPPPVCSAIAGAVGSAGHQLKLVKYEQVEPHLAELTFTSTVLESSTKVRIITPRLFDCSGRTRYPVVWALHGSNNDRRQFTMDTHVSSIMAGYQMIMVMPETSTTCGYFDAYNGGEYGAPAWETYHLRQLLPWLDRHYPTIASRDGRAAVGHSMGGGGAMLYAARRPDLFAAAVSFSGAVDTTNPEIVAINTPQPQCQRAQGDYVTNEVYVRGHNPLDLAANLNGLYVRQFYGNGAPGPLDSPTDPTLIALSLLELDIYQTNVALDAELDRLGVTHTNSFYGSGSHNFAYAERDLVQVLPRLKRLFNHPAPAPQRVTYRSTDARYGAFGWKVRSNRLVTEFSELRNADARGFDLLGSGSARVRTPPRFVPGSRVRVTLSTSTRATTRTLRADRDGRLSLHVFLGPSNTREEYSPEARAVDGLTDAQLAAGASFVPLSPGTAVYTAHVTMRRISR